MSDFVVGDAFVNAVPETPGGPCPWPFDPTCCSLIDSSDPATVDLLTRAATEVLWAATGRQFGECAVTLRPCRRTCVDVPRGQAWWEFGSTDASAPQPMLFDGAWFNLTCGTCGDTCSCHSIEEVVLPGPVTQVLNVTIDGTDLASSAYRVDNGRLLVRQDGGLWPPCNDLSKPVGEQGTWTVEALYGNPVPALGQVAMCEVICELIKACTDDPDCRLPSQLQTLTRQGVTQGFLDPRTLVGAGEHGLITGLRVVNYFVETFNPNRLTQRSAVYSPDLQRPRVVG